MIVELDESIIDALNDCTNLDVICFLGDLCTARRRGYIIADIKKRFSLLIKDNERLSDEHRAIFKIIAEEVTFLRGAINLIDEKVLFYSSAFKNPKPSVSNKVSYDIAGYSTNSGSVLSSPKLVLEDIQDNKVYKAIVNWEKSKAIDLDSFTVSYSPVHGGGGNTAKVCLAEHSAGNRVFSICDSDKRSPVCCCGPTAKKVETFFKSTKQQGNLYVIEVHEVENLIPLSMLDEIANHTQKPAIQFLTFISKSHPSSYLYYDLKEGIKYKSVYENNDGFSSFWKPIFDMYKANIAKFDDLESNDVIICRLSSMLPHAIESIEGYDSKKVSPSLLEHHWSKIGSKMLSWFIASAPIRL